MRKLFLLSFCCYFLLNAHSKTNDSTKFYKNEISAFAGFVSWEQSFAIVGEDHLGIFYYPGEYDDCNLDLRLHFHL